MRRAEVNPSHRQRNKTICSLYLTIVTNLSKGIKLSLSSIWCASTKSSLKTYRLYLYPQIHLMNHMVCRHYKLKAWAILNQTCLYRHSTTAIMNRINWKPTSNKTKFLIIPRNCLENLKETPIYLEFYAWSIFMEDKTHKQS